MVQAKTVLSANRAAGASVSYIVMILLYSSVKQFASKNFPALLRLKLIFVTVSRRYVDPAFLLKGLENGSLRPAVVSISFVVYRLLVSAPTQTTLTAIFRVRE